MSDDTARRERGLVWATGGEWSEEEWDDIVWAQEIGGASADASELVCAYLAGAREEGEVKDREYNGKAMLFAMAQADWLLSESEYKAEIAALREAVRLAPHIFHWTKDGDDRSWEWSKSEFGNLPAVRRALEEKP